MKRKVIIAILSCLLLGACDLLESPKRDNPLDEKNKEYLANNIDIQYDTISVYSDDNNDKAINNGETVRLNVRLKNTGTESASKVEAMFSTDSKYISNLNPIERISYGTIDAGKSCWKGGKEKDSDYAIQFTVAFNAPDNTEIPFIITISDEMGRIWIRKCNIKVVFFLNQKYSIEYTSTDGKIVTPNNLQGFDGNVLSNTYTDGKGIITFDSEITKIGDETFKGCSTLSSIAIPLTVTSIGVNAFANCQSLISFVADGCKTIGMDAFAECYALLEVNMPTVTTTSYESFLNCTSMTSAFFPLLERVSSRCFSGCIKLVRISFPEATRLEYQAFSGCSTLPKVDFPKVKYLEQHSLADCYELTSITFGSVIQEWGLTSYSDTWAGPMHNVSTEKAELTLNIGQESATYPALNIKDRTFGAYTFKSITLK